MFHRYPDILKKTCKRYFRLCLLLVNLIHWPLANETLILKTSSFKLVAQMEVSAHAMKLFWCECHEISLDIGLGKGFVPSGKEQFRANFDPNLYRHMVSLYHNRVPRYQSSWVLSDPDGPHVGPMNLVIRGKYSVLRVTCIEMSLQWKWWMGR